MKEQELTSEVEIYVCNFKKENGDCCYNRGAKDLTDGLKSWGKNQTQGKAKVVRGGCLGKCSEGIAFSLYNKNQKRIFTEVSTADEERIKSLISSHLS